MTPAYRKEALQLVIDEANRATLTDERGVLSYCWRLHRVNCVGQKSPVRPLPDYVPFANDHKCVVLKRHRQNVQASDLSFECPRLIQCKPKRKSAADHGELGEDSQFVCKHLLNCVGSRPTSS